MVHDDDDAWRSIVDNYGDRPELDEPARTASQEQDDAPQPDRYRDPVPDEHEDRFVPPPPPPVPTTTTDRMAAWCGVFGAPAVLLLTLVVGVRLPTVVSYALVAAFVGGFLYLVVKMDREPRDPDDNGAVL